MSTFEQLIVPWAFDLFQFWLGGTIAKRKLALLHYGNQKRILEVGCSIGNIASAFLTKGAFYTGLDIDRVAIRYAKNKFGHQRNFTFTCADLREYAFAENFDYIVFSGVLHHIDDANSIKMLEFSKSLLAPEGCLLVSEPLQPNASDSYIVRHYRKVERGQFVRSKEQLRELITRLEGFSILEQSVEPVTALPVFAMPVVSYFGVFLLTHSKQLGVTAPGSLTGR